MRSRTNLMSIALALSACAATAADGLTTPDSQLLWPQWQARSNVVAGLLQPVSLSDAAARQRKPASAWALLGDYYFDAPGLQLRNAVGGIRATGGLMAGAHGLAPRSEPPLADGAVDPATVYIGFGYTTKAVKGSWTGWGVVADVGVAAEAQGGARVRNALFGNQGFDSTSRELRLSPVLQLGVRYAF